MTSFWRRAWGVRGVGRKKFDNTQYTYNITINPLHHILLHQNSPKLEMAWTIRSGLSCCTIWFLCCLIAFGGAALWFWRHDCEGNPTRSLECIPKHHTNATLLQATLNATRDQCCLTERLVVVHLHRPIAIFFQRKMPATRLLWIGLGVCRRRLFCRQ